jgi:hypothetical protein
MPYFIGENEIVLTPRHEAYESGQQAAARNELDLVLRLKLAEFASFLDEIECCTAALRVDQLEQIISHAVATCGFGSSTEARTALEWMFRRPLELS